jgi:iron complex outermembrane receptor protein
LTLTSITSYAHLQRDVRIDDGGVSWNVLYNAASGKIDTVTQELRLADSSADALRWIAGANYEYDKVHDVIHNQFPQSTSGVVNESLSPDFGNVIFYSTQEMENFAVFAKSDYDVASDWTLKAGTRYTKADRSLPVPRRLMDTGNSLCGDAT